MTFDELQETSELIDELWNLCIDQTDVMLQEDFDILQKDVYRIKRILVENAARIRK